MTITNVLEAAMLAVALSMDSFMASFGYGVNKIKIPFVSAQVVNGICTGMLTAALYLGVALSSVIPRSITTALCCAILLLLGLAKLFDSIIKRQIKKHEIKKNIRFNLLSLKFILHIYSEPETADIDESRVLSPREAAYLAVALSLDGVSVGVGAGLANEYPLMIVAFAFIFGFFGITCGHFLGRSVSEKLKFDLSWLGGAILLGLAVLKLF